MAVIPQKKDEMPRTMLVIASPEVSGMPPVGTLPGMGGESAMMWGALASGSQPAAPSYHTRSAVRYLPLATPSRICCRVNGPFCCPWCWMKISMAVSEPRIPMGGS